MSPRRHTRGRLRNKTAAWAAVLVLGGAGTALVAAHASGAPPGAGGTDGSGPGTAAAAAWSGTVDCPDVGDRLREVPAPARAEVDRLLARMDAQTADAYQALVRDPGAGRQVLAGLRDRRATAVAGVADAIARGGAARPAGLEGLSGCRITPGPQPAGNVSADAAGSGRSGDRGSGNASGNAPARSDFVDIRNVRPNVNRPPRQRNASTGSFRSRCGTNREGRFNSDNVIVAPGVSNGAHHMHDYVGNRASDAFATNDSLAAAGTTCANGDQSTYYWPVLRLQDGRRERDADAPGGGTEGNSGTILTPKEVSITFVGSPAGRVTAMPRFLRIITGDAKAFTNGTANANASWSCTGFEDRQLRAKYPLCPSGSDVVRTFSFQSCWNGRDTDSANHRTHVAFAQADGRCPRGFRAVPQLVQRIVYAVPGGGRSAPFAVDSFPEQLHKPVTDHGDFINVMRDGLMRQAVDCINSGRRCR
ncbi:DUF1996 domain-containing protein [Streptomyces bambusae]|uniref:DUF1996 domain-containing protein n=1 Tax=Streptomyces bambusae TaxID=1550616 RepID=UPI001CFC83CA|nr:DUF1996 domain-containing protein [Streptomyces bambusae]MCB5166747.1 DUF1996 domain-containing protein [Streptomyces bambusae]